MKCKVHRYEVGKAELLEYFLRNFDCLKTDNPPELSNVAFSGCTGYDTLDGPYAIWFLVWTDCYGVRWNASLRVYQVDSSLICAVSLNWIDEECIARNELVRRIIHEDDAIWEYLHFPGTPEEEHIDDGIIVELYFPCNLNGGADTGSVSLVVPLRPDTGKPKSVKMRIYRVSFSLREAGTEYYFMVDVKAQNGVKARKMAIDAYHSECPWRSLGFSVGKFVPRMYLVCVRRKEDCVIYYPDNEDEITYNVCTLISSRPLN